MLSNNTFSSNAVKSNYKTNTTAGDNFAPITQSNTSAATGGNQSTFGLGQINMKKKIVKTSNQQPPSQFISQMQQQQFQQ